MTLFLQANNAQLGAFGAVFMGCAVIGSRIHPLIAKRFGHLNDIRINIVGWIVCCIVSGVTVRGPDQLPIFYGILVVWGIFFGWAVPSMRMLYIILMPKGRETEFMG